jgi:hypothetical protein
VKKGDIRSWVARARKDRKVSKRDWSPATSTLLRFKALTIWAKVSMGRGV